MRSGGGEYVRANRVQFLYEYGRCMAQRKCCFQARPTPLGSFFQAAFKLETPGAAFDDLSQPVVCAFGRIWCVGDFKPSVVRVVGEALTHAARNDLLRITPGDSYLGRDANTGRFNELGDPSTLRTYVEQRLQECPGLCPCREN